MSSLGQVYLAHDRRYRFLDPGQQEPGDYSDSTSQAIDAEIQQIISSQYKVALDILLQRKEILSRGARLLLEKEKIDRDEIKTLMQSS